MSNNAKPDYIFLFIVLMLLSVGLIMVFSASPSVSLKFGDAYYFFKRQIFYLLFSLLAMYAAWRADFERLKRWTPSLFIFSFGLLLLVLVPGIGKKVGGSMRWLDLMLFSFQPSEFIKLTLIMFLALILSNIKERVLLFITGILPTLLITSMVIGAIILEPDLGTAATILAFVFVMLFVAGARLAYLGGLAGIALAGILFLSFTSPYRLRRLMGYINPWNDPLNVGFHVIQSLLAVGSGGFFGLGLGCSKQKFYYLPQQFTDFIFAILCEETGFVGAMVVLVLFLFFVLRGLRIARLAKDSYQSLLVTGIVVWIGIQALVNIFVVIGLLPTTGIPLPFVSYGGSSLLVSLLAVGLILNVSAQAKKRSRSIV